MYTRSGEIDDARRVAFVDAMARSATSATEAARKAATLEPNERKSIVESARIAAIETTMAITIKDTLAKLRANGEPLKIKNVRANAVSTNTLSRISDAAHVIEHERALKTRQVRIRENERIEAIVDAIETRNDNYASIASSIAARERAYAIKDVRGFSRSHVITEIVENAIALVVKDPQVQEQVVEEATIAKIMATITTSVIDRIEDAIEDAVAATCMRTGLIREIVEPSLASAIDIATEDLIYDVITGSEDNGGTRST